MSHCILRGEDKKINKKRIHLLVVVLFMVFIAILPLVCDAPYLFHVIVIANTLALLALSFDVIAGFVGQLNLGQSIFYGVGSYTVGFITMAYDIPGLLGLLFGGIGAAIFSLIVGIPCLRLKGPYYAIATLAFSQVLFTLANAFPSITGSEEGITTIPSFIDGVVGNYYLSFALLALGVLSIRYMFRTEFGKKLISIREDEVLSDFAGVDTSRYKIIGSAISAFMAGVAGSYSCYYLSIASPDSLSIGLTFSVVAVVVFGGIGTIYGAVIGAFVLTFLTEYLYVIQEYRLVVYSGVIMLIVLYFPGGVMTLLKEKVFPNDVTSNKTTQEL